MKHRSVWLLLAFCLAIALLADGTLRAQPSHDIRHVLMDQQNAWNRGDIVDFMHGYDDSPQTTFIGTSIQHGYATILERYRHTYSSRDVMGHLEFGDLQIRMLGDNHAVVTGSFHLTRSHSAGGNASGVFSLVFEKKPSGWKIILDHTTS
jgi:ketosteroid isomerase-like protein